MEVGAPSPPATAPLEIWAVSDGRAGIENQVVGLAEAVARLTPATVTVKRVRWRAAFDWLPVRLKTPAGLARGSDPLGPPWPDLWIAAGRATLPLSVGLRRRSHGRTFVVQVQDPRLDPGLFDLVIAPAHDRVEGPNVVSITGSPNRMMAGALAAAAPGFADRLAPLPRPRVAAMIGGRSRAFDLGDDHAGLLADRIAAAVSDAGGSLMLTFSRRTPETARAIMTERLRRLPGLIWDGRGDNPLFAFLHYADHVLVTEDSANMAAEAATTGKPVHVLPMVRIGRADKFDRLHADLSACGAARAFDGNLDAWTYTPLKETERAANAVVAALRSARVA